MNDFLSDASNRKMHLPSFLPKHVWHTHSDIYIFTQGSSPKFEESSMLEISDLVSVSNYGLVLCPMKHKQMGEKIRKIDARSRIGYRDVNLLFSLRTADGRASEFCATRSSIF